MVVAQCRRRSRGDLELLLHGRTNAYPGSDEWPSPIPDELHLICDHLKVHENAVNTSALRPALRETSSTEYRKFLRATVFSAEGCRLGMPGALAALLGAGQFRRE